MSQTYWRDTPLTKRFKNLDNIRDAFKILKDRKDNTRILEMTDFFEGLKWNPLNESFLAVMDLKDENDENITVEVEVAPYALRQLFRFIKLKDLIGLLQSCFEMDLLSTYPDCPARERKNTKEGELNRSGYVKKFIENENADIGHQNKVLELMQSAWFFFRTKSTRAKKVYAVITDDLFGNNARAFVSEDYAYVDDYDFFVSIHETLETSAEMKFDNARISGLKTEFNYTEPTPIDIMEDEHTTGISITNSSFKFSSVWFKKYIKRVICSNGLFATELGDVQKHVHYLLKDKKTGEKMTIEEFVKLISESLNTLLEDQKSYIKRYKELENYKTDLFENWNQLRLFNKDKLKIKSESKVDKLIEIAIAENYTKNVYGIVNAMTYYNTHEKISDIDRNIMNERANEIILDAASLSLWEAPKQIEAEA